MSETRLATVGGGCFWCTEAVYKEVEGVLAVTSGYAGGHVEDPTYEAVCSGETGHAEVVQVEYDPSVIDYPELLAIFFTVHDPTTVDRQGPDVGSQYRSAIYYHDEEQRDIAESYIEELDAEDAYDDPIVTEVEPLETFYEAEAYHQDYYEKNPGDGYCQFNADPKIRKVREKFADRVKQEA
ncbi:peptide-methionine (S)-S-oxide reductase MsrA [Halomarina rubra]|uniref:Peptide methionine sulfoxide reductase MsrA n=1 Tax=Halomarina rubra TaxID=2071873 RepID=A0ABD6B0N1_9EURY|nr:peptide-methionine (S)-S-oxide reductase MsrA [Halomarina rubra]